MLVSDLFQLFPDLDIANYTCDNTLHSTKKIERAISTFRGRDKYQIVHQISFLCKS